MTNPSIAFSKKVIKELLEIQEDIEDASKLSTKVIKQNVNDIDTIVHKIENRLVPKGGSNQPIFRERVSKATLRRFLYIFVVIAGISISHIVYGNNDDLRFAISENLIVVLKKVEDFVNGINLFANRNLLTYTTSVIEDLWYSQSDDIEALVNYHSPSLTVSVSVGSLVVTVNKVTDILYKLINPTKKDTRSNEKKDHSPVKVVSDRIEKYHSPVKVVSNSSEKYHTPVNVKVVSNPSEKYHTPVNVNVVSDSDSDSDSVERYYTPMKEHISEPKKSIKIPNAKIKISKEKKEYKKRVTKIKISKEKKEYKKRVTKKKITKEEKPKVTMIETEKNIYNIYINEN